MTDEEFQAHMNTLRGEKLPEDRQSFAYEGWQIYRLPRKKIVCKDGFEVSVQGGWGKYSSPRCDESDHYSSWELGFPTERPTDEVMEHCENPEDPTQTVYGYVPTEKVIALIVAHGGLSGAPS
jgi:hypothetical protein